MERPEVPIEHLHEHIHEQSHGKGGWIVGVALSSALVAALAAVASLIVGHSTNYAMILQMQATDRWSFYQAKGVKSNVLQSKMEMLTALGKTPDPKDVQKAAQYREEQPAIQKDATEKQQVAQEYLETEEVMAQAVTIFQVTIAIGAISALTKRRSFWFVSLAAATVGFVIFVHGSMMYSHLPHVELNEKAETGGGGGHEGGKPHEGAKAAEHEHPAGTKE